MPAEATDQSTNDKLTIEEHRSSVWKPILFISLFVAILFFILFLIVHDPLMIGIFRLVAFIGFAAFVLSFLQIQGKISRIKIEPGKEKLIISYFSSSQKSQEELFDIATIDQVKQCSAPAVWKVIPRKDCSKLQISFTDSSNELSLLRRKGRDLYVTHSDAKKAVNFLDKHLNQKTK